MLHASDWHFGPAHTSRQHTPEEHWLCSKQSPPSPTVANVDPVAVVVVDVLVVDVLVVDVRVVAVFVVDVGVVVVTVVTVVVFFWHSPTTRSKSG